MSRDSFEVDPQRQSKRRLGPKTWAMIGCAALMVLALATLGSCGLLVSRVVDWLSTASG